MLFNGKECVVVDDVLITPEGVRDIVADAMMAIVPIVWGESDAPDAPTPTTVGGTEVCGGRRRNLMELNSTDLWVRETLRENAPRWDKERTVWPVKPKRNK